jgi:hypothetical protein
MTMVMMINIEKILNDGTRSFGPAMFSIGFFLYTWISVIHYLDNKYNHYVNIHSFHFIPL